MCLGAATTQAQPQTPETAVAVPVYKYDVVSVKPSEPGCGYRHPMQFCTPTETPDGFHGVIYVGQLIRMAFGLVSDDQISDAPSWVKSNVIYEIDAKMDDARADALKKLAPDARKLARQHMLQALLAERFKLVFHRETKELQVYTLFVGKNGAKVQPSNSDFKINGIKPAAGSSGFFGIGNRGADTFAVMGIDISMGDLATRLVTMLGQPVLDKTGLTGRYDFDVQFLAGDSQPPNVFGGEAASPPPPPGREFLPLAALQALGFRVESGKAPIEIIVIDHVEKPSGN